MPTRFRRSFNILPGVKVNVSKSGISFTVGTKGYHLNFSNRGVRQTVGLPGSGLSNSSYIVKNDSKSENERPARRKAAALKNAEDDAVVADTVQSDVQDLPVRRRRSSPWMLLLGIVVVYLGALVLQLIPTNFLSQLLSSLTQWARGLGL
jgi:hypothetical protein